MTCTDRGGRGCPCAFHSRRRVYAREYARRQRRKVIVAKRMSARTCPKRFGKHGVCGGVLESDVIAGRLVVRCPACERFERGICRDCPAPVYGTPRKARRCAVHRDTANLAACRKSDENNRAEVNRRARASYKNDPAERERRNEYGRQYRKANPDKVKAWKKREAEKASPRQREYLAEYRAAHRVRYRNMQNARNAGTLPLRTCITKGCSIVLTGRKKKCTRCKERERAAALAKLGRAA